MHRFKNIGVVFHLERSNADVLAHAKELVITNRASIHILCILPQAISDEQKSSIEATLKEKIDFENTLQFLTGKPVVEITRYSAEKNLDMVLVEPDQEKGIVNRFFQGALTLSMMRKTPCPVWVVKRPLSKFYERIVIAVDPRCGDEAGNVSPLNDKLIQIGTSYAERQGAECYLVTAWRLEGESMLEGPYINTPSEEIERLQNEEKEKCARAFEAIAVRHKDTLRGSQTCILHGDPGIAIAKFVEEKNIDMIVMGTLARSGIKGFIIGNTAESIINQVDCSIMAIKPDGFISPILT